MSLFSHQVGTHSGAVIAVDWHPTAHTAATGGLDASVCVTSLSTPSRKGK